MPYTIPPKEQAEFVALVDKALEHAEQMQTIKAVQQEKDNATWTSKLYTKFFGEQPTPTITTPASSIDKGLNKIKNKMDEVNFDNIISLLISADFVEARDYFIKKNPEKYYNLAELKETTQTITIIQHKLEPGEKILLLNAFTTLELAQVSAALESILQEITTREKLQEIINHNITAMEESLAKSNISEVVENQDFLTALKNLAGSYPDKYGQYQRVLENAKNYQNAHDTLNASVDSALDRAELENIAHEIIDMLQQNELEQNIAVAKRRDLLTDVTNLAQYNPKKAYTLYQALLAVQSLSPTQKLFTQKEKDYLLRAIETIDAKQINTAFQNINTLLEERKQAQVSIQLVENKLPEASKLDDFVNIVLGDFAKNVALISKNFPDKYRQHRTLVHICTQAEKGIKQFTANEKRTLLDSLRIIDNVDEAKPILKNIFQSCNDRRAQKNILKQKIADLSSISTLPAMLDALKNNELSDAINLLAEALGGKYERYQDILNNAQLIEDLEPLLLESEKNTLIGVLQEFVADDISDKTKYVASQVKKRKEAKQTYEEAIATCKNAESLPGINETLQAPELAAALQCLNEAFPQYSEYRTLQKTIALSEQAASLDSDLHQALLQGFRAIDNNKIISSLKEIKKQNLREQQYKETVKNTVNTMRQPIVTLAKPYMDSSLQARIDALKDKEKHDLTFEFNTFGNKKSPVKISALKPSHYASESAILQAYQNHKASSLSEDTVEKTQDMSQESDNRVVVKNHK